MLRLNEDWKVGAGALPSFYIKEGNTGAKLGASPRIDYKNFALIALFSILREQTNGFGQ